MTSSSAGTSISQLSTQTRLSHSGRRIFLKATYLELRTGNVEEVQQQIIDFGVKVIEIDDPHLY